MAEPITSNWIDMYANSKKRISVQEIVDKLVKEHMCPDYDTILALLKENIDKGFDTRALCITIDYSEIKWNTEDTYEITIKSQMLDEAYHRHYDEWFAKYFPASTSRLFTASTLYIRFTGQ